MDEGEEEDSLLRALLEKHGFRWPVSSTVGFGEGKGDLLYPPPYPQLQDWVDFPSLCTPPNPHPVSSSLEEEEEEEEKGENERSKASSGGGAQLRACIFPSCSPVMGENPEKTPRGGVGWGGGRLIPGYRTGSVFHLCTPPNPYPAPWRRRKRRRMREGKG